MSKVSNPHFSVLVTFRNRELERAKMFLESLDFQSFKNFELIFVDYGSNEDTSFQLSNVVKEYAFCRLIYAETQGLFWNKAEALNLALNTAVSENIIVSDIDLLYPPNFLQELSFINLDKTYLKYRCYYLSKEVSNPKNLINKNNLTFESRYFSDFKATGLIVSKKKYMLHYNGYDRFYRYWGGEDRDMLLQLEAQGIVGVLFDNANTPVFHQWHPNLSDDLPKGWTKVYNEHLNNKKEAFKSHQIIRQHNKMPYDKNRPALKIYESGIFDSSKEFKFASPLEKSFVDFSSVFFQLIKGDYLFIRQDFYPILQNQKSRLRKVFKFFNKILKKTKISYRLVDIKTYDTQLILSNQIRDFIFYFVLKNEELILDYFFEQKEDEIIFIVYKS